jgi:hypothetical protein
MSDRGDHRKEPSSSHPQWATQNWTSRPRRWSENRRKPIPRWWPSWMSSGADHGKEPSSSHPPISHRKIRSIDPGVGQKINGNQLQDGGHLGWVAELIIKRNLPLLTPNKSQKNQINRPRRLSSIRRKPNPRWNEPHKNVIQIKSVNYTQQVYLINWWQHHKLGGILLPLELH